MVQSAGQTIISAVYSLFASPIAGSIGPGNWYILGAGLNAVVFILSIFLVPESKCNRSLLAYGQAAEVVALGKLDDIEDAPAPHNLQRHCHRRPLQLGEQIRSYVNTGQTVTALVALPVFGNGSDWLIRRQARRNGGVHGSENRRLPLGIPIIVGVIASVIYGQAAAHPDQHHWFAIVRAYAAYYFAFVGSNIVGITYLLDSYPTRAAPVLVVICAFRGFVSFGTSYGVTRFIETAGYDGSFGAYAGMTAFFGLLGSPVFLYGKRIRVYTGRWAQKEITGKPSMAH
ncbi:hypothetical protein LTR49_024920 [Elasticomyces elasticus]|nr:hypothetical protein LTR49_024920 [Elasticomyces elasticus]